MSARVLIGSLRRRVTIEAPLDVPDEFGGFARSFAPLAQVWAKVETLSTSDQFVEQRLEEVKRFAVTIRWRDDVKSQMRFDLRGRKLLIRSVEDNDERRRVLRCLCEEFL